MRRDARDADVIVTISNDSWFGHSIGPHQHLQMVRMRALENGRYVLRATNNGITAIVAPTGSVVAQVPQFEPVVLDGTFSGMSGATPYRRGSATSRCSSLLAIGIAISLYCGAVTAR